MPTYTGITVSELTVLQNAEDEDFLIINDTSLLQTKKITVANLLKDTPKNVEDSESGGVVLLGDSRVDGDLEVENEIIAGGDISTSGNISFGSLTDYVNNVTVLQFVDSANGITLFDSSVPTSLAIREYVGSNKGYSRASLSATTVAMVQNDSVSIDISAYKSYALLKVSTDSAAWVRIYCDSASRSADIGRAYGTPASDSSGLIAEINTVQADTITLSPGVIGYNNSTPIIGIVPVKVTKITAGSAPSGITVTLTALKLED